MSQQPVPETGCIIWRLLDGKPGHENQTLGLSMALEGLLPVKRFDIHIQVTGGIGQLYNALLGRFPSAAGLPKPDLIIAAGHATHLPLLAAQRHYGGRTVVLMKPTLPRQLFDLCIVPEHDNVRGKNLFLTKGVLNTIQPSTGSGRGQTLLLVGGLSAHYGWDDEAMLQQILTVVDRGADRQFILTNSRRTPETFLHTLASVGRPQLTLVPWQQTAPGWVAQQLAASSEVWVTEDSVSMVYEALTAGGRVGLLRLPSTGEGRVTRGIGQLLEAGCLTAFDQWLSSGVLASPGTPFNESRRCAEWIYERWLKRG